MKYEIVYTTNEELWKIEKIAKSHGYKKTQECYWVQIFEDTNGNHIVMTREDGELLSNPCDKLEAMLRETASKETQEAAEEAQKESTLDKVASELKKTRHGERRPNSREEWLDTQARALYQACNRVARLYRSIMTV